MSGFWNQAGCDYPGVFAGTSGRQESPVETLGIGGDCDLSEVVEVQVAPAFRGSKVTSVAMGGNKPEDLHGSLLESAQFFFPAAPRAPNGPT